MLVCHLYIFSEESVQPFGPCFNWIVCFLIIELYKLFWYSLDNKYLSDMYFTDIFHKSVAYPQILLTVCFVQQTFLFQRNQTLNSFMDWSQFSSVAKSCPTLCDPMDCSTSGSLFFTISWCLLRFMSIELVMLSNHLTLCCPLVSQETGSFPASGSFPMSRLFTSGGQSIGDSASASVLPMNIQD